MDDGVSRYGHRLREIAVQSMVASTAAERAQRALQSKTRPSIQAVNYQIGDQVEFWRDPANKDLPGWRGPATVVNVKPNGDI
eukprot:3901940-Prorocentrum_lima.AAC.1